MVEGKTVVFIASLGVNPKGVGKTMLMTESVFKDWLENGKKVIANYHLYFPDVNDGKERPKPIYMPYEEIITFPDELYNANVCLDEIVVGANARRSFSKQNIALLEFISQLRKRNCDLFITAQTARQIDVGIREQIDIIVEMKKHKEDGVEIPLFFDVVVRDRHEWDPLKNVLNRFIYDGRWLVSLDIYDTDEIIKSNGSIRGKGKNKEEPKPIESEVEEND